MDRAGKRLEPSLNVAADLKKAMNQAIKGCGLSRPQIADRMNELLQEEGMQEVVTLDVLNSWTKEDPRRVIPTRLLTFFCKATDSILPLIAMARPFEAMVIKGKDLDLLELGMVEYEERQSRP